MSDDDPHNVPFAAPIDGRSGLTRRAWLARAAGAGVGLAGHGPLTAFAQGAPRRGGTLRVATVDKPGNMDPGYAQLYSSLQIYQNVYNKLAYVDEAGQFLPGLARSWEKGDRKTRPFHPVGNAAVHNRGALTA